MKTLHKFFAAISIAIAAILFVIGGLWLATAGVFAALAKWWLEDQPKEGNGQ